MSAFDIIAQVQQADLAQAEERVKSERDMRRILRLQAGGSGVPIGELLRKLTGQTEEDAQAAGKDPATPTLTSQERTNEQRNASFPPPPSGPGSSSSAPS